MACGAGGTPALQRSNRLLKSGRPRRLERDQSNRACQGEVPNGAWTPGNAELQLGTPNRMKAELELGDPRKTCAERGEMRCL